jgi:hypothetical protein
MRKGNREVRASWLHLRLTPAELAEVRARAGRDGVPVSHVARAGLALILASPQASVEGGNQATLVR